MKWLPGMQGPGGHPPDAELQALQGRFADFLALLDANNQVLKTIGDMEEKTHGEHRFDALYIRACLAEIETGMREIIARMISLGGPSYEPLRERLLAINAEIEGLFSGKPTIRPDAYTIPFDELGRDRADSVGSKNAQLGELKSRLGLPVPDGFAITAWAYKRFVDSNDLQARITEAIKAVDIRRYDDLARVSSSIQAMVAHSPVPEDLAQSIRKSYQDLAARSGSRTFSMRSSAIAEDSLFSFAGQYRSFLNIRPEELIERYRGVLASKFTPQAIYYFLSHDLAESELAMSACCVAMIDAAASGVAYTRDPVQPSEDCVLVSSIYGLGKYLVDGKLTPDVFCVSRATGQMKHSRLARKPVRLVLRNGGGIVEEPVPASEQDLPSISREHLQALAEYAGRIEDHYAGPQDIEWVVDRNGQLYLLQTRPLRVIRIRPQEKTPGFEGSQVLRSGGTTVCPGAGCGPIFHAGSTQDLSAVPRGAVLVARNPFPGLVTAMGKIAALVTEVGGVASHMATLAREYRIPTLVGVERAAELPAAIPVTVDASAAAIYEGVNPELCAARSKTREMSRDAADLGLLMRVLDRVSRLNLVRPADPKFRIENCRTLHDITRFAHQKAMDEMFARAKRLGRKERIGRRLKTELPLEVHIIYVDQELDRMREGRWIHEDSIACIPLRAFWSGVRKEGKVTGSPPAEANGPFSGLATRASAPDRGEFIESSYAILGREYMIISLGLGYHFTTVEAMCTGEPSKNYIRIQYKGGGAALDRRIRRILLMCDLLSKLGFEHSGEGDFLDSSLAYLDAGGILRTLEMLGRITMMTKQLDMTLANDAIARWYTQDFSRQLGLEEQ
ncbi:MAG: PEP/pyruvate-binding domain-containing protein [Acidobacteriota bacterium]